MPHESSVPALPCAGSDGWAILAQPPGNRDLIDLRYWETSLERSLRRRGTRPLRIGRRPHLQAAVVLALAGLAAPAVAGASSLDLSRGSSGDAVVRLQQKLGIDADGAFGPRTEAAVRAYQRSHGIPATGLVGPLTRAALGLAGSAAGASSTEPSSPAEIRALQRRLGVTVDGIMGPQTRAALAAAGGPGPASPTQQQSTTTHASSAVQAALSKVGAPYSYGASGPSSFDCSGLVMWAFRQVGVSLPHSSYAQYGMGQSVSADQIQAGDLVFFDTAGSGASDVGIATSATEAVSATTHGVMTHPIRSGYWGSHFVGARRIA